MKLHLFIAFFIVSLNCPGQIGSKVDTTIFNTITIDICNCLISAMKFNHPMRAIDSCRNVSFSKNANLLKGNGIDTSTFEGKVMLDDGTDLNMLSKTCPDVYALMQREITPDYSKRIYFTGRLISQKLLANGLYEISIENKSSKRIIILYSDIQFLEAWFIPPKGAETIFEYESEMDNKTNKTIPFLKDFRFKKTIKINSQ